MAALHPSRHPSRLRRDYHCRKSLDFRNDPIHRRVMQHVADAREHYQPGARHSRSEGNRMRLRRDDKIRVAARILEWLSLAQGCPKACDQECRILFSRLPTFVTCLSQMRAAKNLVLWTALNKRRKHTDEETDPQRDP